MSKKAKDIPAAVIDIGSNELRLRIAQDVKGKMRILESLSYPLRLGSDTFNTGKINFETVEKTCQIIKNFMQVASEYGAVIDKAVATTALREAHNKDYILDQIFIKTGITVNVFDDSQEKLYIYKIMGHLLQPAQQSSALVVYIGSGNIGLSVWKEGKVPFSRNIRIGSLRISEIFEDIQEYSSQFYTVVEEYLDSYTSPIEEDIPAGIKYFVASGQEIAMISELCNARKDGVYLYISSEKFYALYEEIKVKTIDRIAHDYHLSLDKAEVLLPAMCIYKTLLESTKVKEIIAIHVFLSDALLFESLYPDAYNAISKEFIKSTIISAKAIADKFHTSTNHYSLIEQFSLNIFDKMRKIHGMGKKEKLLLQTAAILHDIGKFINCRNHYTHSYHIIQGVDLIGLSALEKEIVANLALYHSRITPQNDHDNYTRLSRENQVLISKLSAILRVADSLDRSQKQKFSSVDVKITEEQLIITASANVNTDLEEWSFNEKSKFFTEVFGSKPILKIKRLV